MNEEMLHPGLIIDENTVSQYDFILGGESDLSKKLKLRQNTNTVKHYYNQAAQSRTLTACVLYSGAGVVGDLTGYEFSLSELLEIVDRAEKDYGRIQGNGMYLSKGIDCVRHYWNEKQTEQLISFRVEIGSPEFIDALNKGYSIQIGYLTSTDYYKDSQDDGIIQGVDFENLSGGHAVRCYKEDGIVKIADNYEGKKRFNEYTNEHLEELKDNGVFFTWGYLFLKKENMIFTDVSEEHPFAEHIKWLKDNGISKGYDDGTFRPNQTITRGEMAVMLKKLNDISK